MRQRGRRIGTAAATASILAAGLTASPAAASDAGRLDPGYGEVRTDIGDWDLDIHDTAVTAGGDIIAVGRDNERGESLVMKIRADGALDTSFGGGDGWTTLPVSGGGNSANGVAMTAGGSIVVAGETSIGGYLARLNAAGLADTSLSGDGIVAFPDVDGFRDVAVDSSGRLVAIGRAWGDDLRYDWLVVGFEPDGSVDSAFGDNGTSTIGYPGIDDSGSSVHIDASGRIYAVGTVAEGGTGAAVARLDAAGLVDTSYGDNGLARGPVDFGGDLDSILLADGRVVIASQGPDGELWISRFSALGALDTSFAGDGTQEVLLNEDLPFQAAHLARQDDGAVLVGGITYRHLSFRKDTFLVRVLPNGALDSSFADSGVMTSCCVDGLAGIALLPNSRVVVLSTEDVPGPLVGDPIATRYLVATAYFTDDADLGPFEVTVRSGNESLTATVTPALRGSDGVQFRFRVDGAGTCTQWTGQSCTVDGLKNGRAYAVEVTILHGSIGGQTFATQSLRPKLDCAEAPRHAFADVSVTSFAADSISCIRALGVTTGTGPSAYSPSDAVTREQMAAFLARTYRVVTGDSCSGGATPFVDIASSFARNDVGCIYGLSVTRGTSPTSYGPDELVSREQMAAFLGRLHHAVTGKACPVVPVPFLDSADSFASAEIACIYGLGITTGTSPTAYSPGNVVTREQMAAFLERFYNLV